MNECIIIIFYPHQRESLILLTPLISITIYIYILLLNLFTKSIKTDVK